MADSPAPSGPPKRPGAKAFADIAAKSKSFRPPRETLRRVRAVPTIFPVLDYKLRVGGWPIDRIAIVHGPSAAGKTFFVQGLGLSFLRRGHMFFFVDAEMSTPFPWVESLFGEYADGGGFFASRPLNYEQCVDDVRRMAEGVAEARERKQIAPDVTALFVVDSMGKLVPKNLQEKIRKGAESDKGGGVDGMSGGAGRTKAALHKAWLDELVPLMHHTGCAFVTILRESVDPNASAKDRQFGADWKLQGGNSPFYESSVAIRVATAARVHEGPEKEQVWVGDRHSVLIEKTKVSVRDAEGAKAVFHTSNGAGGAPEGFDRARDVLWLAKDLGGVVKESGSWISFGKKRWQGEARFVKTVSEQELAAMEEACRAKFSERAAKIADVVGAQ